MYSWYPQYWPGGQAFMEAEYRKRIQQLYQNIEKAFEEIDPDIAECEQTMGALTITFADRSRCILSAQPSVRQLWLALASQGTAYHFNYQDLSATWIDDKGRNVELVSFLEKYLKEATGLEITINR
jgi:iron donor protein CyaY